MNNGILTSDEIERSTEMRNLKAEMLWDKAHAEDPEWPAQVMDDQQVVFKDGSSYSLVKTAYSTTKQRFDPATDPRSLYERAILPYFKKLVEQRVVEFVTANQNAINNLRDERLISEKQICKTRLVRALEAQHQAVTVDFPEMLDPGGHQRAREKAIREENERYRQAEQAHDAQQRALINSINLNDLPENLQQVYRTVVAEKFGNSPQLRESNSI